MKKDGNTLEKKILHCCLIFSIINFQEDNFRLYLYHILCSSRGDKPRLFSILIKQTILFILLRKFIQIGKAFIY